MSKKNLDKAISICSKSLASADEIINYCGVCSRIEIKSAEKDWSKGLLSCSIRQKADSLAICIWQEHDSEYKRIAHFDITSDSLVAVKAYMDTALQIVLMNRVKPNV